jgi:hypothetical protein
LLRGFICYNIGMTYRGHIENGQVAFDEPAQLPEGTAVKVEVIEPQGRITSPKKRMPLRDITPIELPGGPLSEDIIRDRR